MERKEQEMIHGIPSFKELRFDKNHHLGLGDVRLTIAMQEEIDVHVAKLRKALKLASNEIAHLTGTCPQDLHGWCREEGWLSCEDICKEGIEASCWKIYFESRALKETK